MSETELSLLKLPDLKARCKEKQLPVSGTKAELIARLLGTAPPAKKAKTVSARTKSVPTTRLDKPVFQSFLASSDRDPIVIKRNAYGHFEHLETHLVFSAQKKVVGLQVDGNPVPQPLTTKDLEYVHKYHFELDPDTVVHDPLNTGVQDGASTQARLEELYAGVSSPKLYRQEAALDLTNPELDDLEIE